MFKITWYWIRTPCVFWTFLVYIINLQPLHSLQRNDSTEKLFNHTKIHYNDALMHKINSNHSKSITYEKLLDNITLSKTENIIYSMDPINHDLFLKNNKKNIVLSLPEYQTEMTNFISHTNYTSFNNSIFYNSINKSILEWKIALCVNDFIYPKNKTNSTEAGSNNHIFVQFRAEYDLIVGDLLIKNSNDSSLTVEWVPPNEVDDFDYYIVKWFRGQSIEGECYTNKETTNYTITHLQSCTKYEIRVLPARNNTCGQERVVIGTTGLIVETNSLKLKIADNGTDWLKISWSIPGSDCVTKTVIKYCRDYQCEETNVTQTFYNATNLLPCTTYNFTVTFYGESEEFGSTDIIGVTGYLKPQAPSFAWSIAEHDSLNIFWTAPIGASCVIVYRITIYQDHPYNNTFETNSTAEYQIKFNNLQSCSIYNIIIVPVDKFENDCDPYLFFSNKTLAPVPETPDYMSSISERNEIAIIWILVINEFNNCENMKVITFCDCNKVLGIGYNCTNSTSTKHITEECNQTIVTTKVKNLTPYTQYKCFSITSNAHYNSSKSNYILLQTSEDIPSPPSLAVFNITDKKFELTWKSPLYLPGDIVNFEVNFTWYYKFHQPKWCENISDISENTVRLNGSTLLLLYEAAVPFSNHRASIRAKTSAGWSNYSESISFSTLPGAPGPVSNFKYSLKKSSDNIRPPDAFLSWGLPCHIFGLKIEVFELTGIGTRTSFLNHYVNETIKSQICIDDICTIKLLLKEEYTYQFSVAGRVKDVKPLGAVERITSLYPAGIPSDPDAAYINQITIDPFKARRTTYSALILLPLFPNTNGEIKCYAIIVSKIGHNNKRFSRNDLKSGEWPKISSWIESVQKDFTVPYQASKLCNDSYHPYVVDYGKLKAVKFQIGEDMETCPELSKSKTSYCNGPLKSDTWYDIRMRAFTDGGYRDSEVFTIKTNAELQIATIIGSIVGILAFGVLITLFLLMKKWSVQTVIRRLLNSKMPGSPVPAPLNRRKFITHCQQLADNPGKLSNEFQLLQTLSLDLQMPTNAGCLHANRKKNRYTDILPYDFSRVKLEIIDNDPNSDYINASFIKGFSNEEEYIACQAPKEETTYDFWRMVEQYNIKLIVMLTLLIEKNKEKCYQYFPTIRETFTYENMSIRCSMEFDYRSYTQRTLVLQKGDEKRVLNHLQFKDWPDHDAPEDFDAVINFCQIMRRNINSNRNLVVIHCSSGIGRTGTLIAIDIILQHLKDNRKLDVFGTVYRLRQQRINMVQRESQYTFIYNCIKQVLKNPHFSKNYKLPYLRPISDDNTEKNNMDPCISNLFKDVDRVKPSIESDVD
ncbi:receptor-type tyrosine-protein phosphatase beta isoform X1 [Microplitis demolitor]|uniref:receptor-type tyrosine-protein phosphatase beta isoform X1 n=1 Tax=Microplitis demolitor TaxID=69319 RepID=UPI000440025D|nr:receptor-type tyrosine-protein phosphatase beta isoform X1 [Microplitis demolitor]XP_008546123.1 receptor-type tyrosine-protein phosphatase beta isoform X1 [Microplitis demolitor]XP_053594579.1 receptor-type tyrosine-protein phosphatase beta isoform X1 [Microplitis demolitor]XP_053594581.1 receptor-type tyrosine-protein phosphatase beta isoform X1 [Microplitis demolitor]